MPIPPINRSSTHPACRDSAAPQRAGGGLELDDRTARVLLRDAGRSRRARARRHRLPGQPAHVARSAATQDIAYAFQARIELHCEAASARARPLRLPLGRHDLRHRRPALSRRREYAVGRNTCGGLGGRTRPSRASARLDRSVADGRGRAGRAERGHLRASSSAWRRSPQLGGERRGAGLVRCLDGSAGALRRLDRRPASTLLAGLPSRRRETGEQSDRRHGGAAERIDDGHQHLSNATSARALAFRIMNEAIARRRGGATPARAAIRLRYDAAGLAAVPARLHPAQPRRPRRQDPRRPRDRRPPVLPDRRRQDRGLSRPRRLHHRPSPAARARACSAPASPSSCATPCAC